MLNTDNISYFEHTHFDFDEAIFFIDERQKGKTRK